MFGHKFNRQKPILNYIVDFYCKSLNLVIEIDGASHAHEEMATYDQKRQQELEAIGLKVIRFDDLEVKNDMSNVLRVIENYIEEYEDD